MEVFLHIPKCGGFSIIQYYKHYYNNVLIVKLGRNADISPKDFKLFDRCHCFEAIVGHLTYQQFLSNKFVDHSKANIFSIVRNPIDRIISLYNYILSNKNHPMHVQIRSIEPSIFLMNQEANFQLKFLGYAEHNNNFFEILEKIKVVPIERCEDYIKVYFKSLFPKQIVPEFARLNVTAKTFSPPLGYDFINKSDLDQGLLDFLFDKHELDMEFFKFVTRLSGLAISS